MNTHTEQQKPVIISAELSGESRKEVSVHTCYLTGEVFTRQPGQVLHFLDITFTYPSENTPYSSSDPISPTLVAAGPCAIKAAMHKRIESLTEEMNALVEDQSVLQRVLASGLALAPVEITQD